MQPLFILKCYKLKHRLRWNAFRKLQHVLMFVQEVLDDIITMR